MRRGIVDALKFAGYEVLEAAEGNEGMPGMQLAHCGSWQRGDGGNLNVETKL